MMRHLAIAIAAAGLPACESVTSTAPAARIADAKSAEQISVISRSDFESTSQRLKSAITARGLTLFSEIDHGAGATSAGLELAPSRLFIFGNPTAGTLFLQADGRMGLDLPLKMLVRETRPGNVEVRYTDIDRLAASYDIKGLLNLRTNVARALQAIAFEAAGH